MKVLVADDDFITRKTLSSMIELKGFECCLEANGTAALELLLSPEAPPVAVLDWQMPGMNGIDIIRELRRKCSDYIYCILLTGKSDPRDIEKGFEAGADDFIVKPANLSTIHQRLNVARRIMEYDIKARALQNELNKYADSMKLLAEDRAKQLIHADRLATLGTLSAGLAHEINNPATYIAGNIQMIKKSWKVILEKVEFPEDAQLDFILEEFPKMLDGAVNGIERITKIVSSLKKYYRKNPSEHKVLFTLDAAVQESLELCKPRLKHGINVEYNGGQSQAEVLAEKSQIEQVIINLINNAVDAMEMAQAPTMSIRLEEQEDFIWLFLSDNGSGIPKKIQARLFDPFFSTKTSENGTGLGLAISRSIIEDHGGKLLCKTLEVGTCFYFSLPVAKHNLSS